MVKGIEQQLGSIDVLVNNAGLAIHKPFDQITEEDWDRTIAINLKSAFLVTKATLPVCGPVVSAALSIYLRVRLSLAEWWDPLRGQQGRAPWFNPWVRLLLVKEGITVNAVAPSIIETEMLADNPRVNPGIVR